MIITKEYLEENPNHIFVFGDNTQRVGNGGAAKLRPYRNTYGFITKRYPLMNLQAYYTLLDYEPVFWEQMHRLMTIISTNPNKTFLISKVGAGLANHYGIWESIIEPNIKLELRHFDNVKFLF